MNGRDVFLTKEIYEPSLGQEETSPKGQLLPSLWTEPGSEIKV